MHYVYISFLFLYFGEEDYVVFAVGFCALRAGCVVVVHLFDFFAVLLDVVFHFFCPFADVAVWAFENFC